MKKLSKKLVVRLGALTGLAVMGFIAMAQAQWGGPAITDKGDNPQATGDADPNAPQAIPDGGSTGRNEGLVASKLLGGGNSANGKSPADSGAPPQSAMPSVRFASARGSVEDASPAQITPPERPHPFRSTPAASGDDLAPPSPRSMQASDALQNRFARQTAEEPQLPAADQLAQAPRDPSDQGAQLPPAARFGGASQFVADVAEEPTPGEAQLPPSRFASDSRFASETNPPPRSAEGPSSARFGDQQLEPPTQGGRFSGNSLRGGYEAALGGAAAALAGTQNAQDYEANVADPRVPEPGRFDGRPQFGGYQDAVAADVGTDEPPPAAPTDSLAGSPGMPDGLGKPGDPTLEGPQTPSITIEKLAPAEIQVGKPAEFKIRVRNVGRATAENVVIRDAIPHGTRLLETVPKATQVTGGTAVWDLGMIPPEQSKELTLKVMPLLEGEIGSVAKATFEAQAGTRTICTRPELVLEHTLPREVLIGQPCEMSITLSNPGTGAATGVVLQEDVPDGLSHPAGQELEFEVGTLKPGESRELKLTLTAAKAGVIENLLVAQGDGNLFAEHRVQLEVIAPRLTVGMDGPRRRYLERRATYTVHVSNPGTASARNVELAAFLPKGLKFLETNNAGQYDAQQHAVLWSLEELPSNRTGSVELVTMPIETGEQKIRIEGAAAMDLAAEFEQNITVDGLAALFFEVADVADPIEVGRETTYEIRVVNEGSKSSTNIRVGVEVPPQMKPVAGEGPSRGMVDGQRVIFQPLARLAPKADALYKVRVQGLQAGDQRIRVQVMSDEVQIPVTKEESTRVYSDE